MHTDIVLSRLCTPHEVVLKSQNHHSRDILPARGLPGTFCALVERTAINTFLFFYTKLVYHSCGLTYNWENGTPSQTELLILT